MYTIYGDDSADGAHRRVFGVGTVYGDKDDWASLKREWNERTGGVPFHATDCDSDQGDYRGRPHRENKALYRDLVQLVCKSRVLATSSTLNLKEYKEVFPHSNLDHAYYLCFYDAVVASVTYASACLPPAPIEVIFDNRAETTFNAANIYDSMSRRPEWSGLLHIPNKVSFMDRREIGVQVADLIARESAKYCENLLFGNRPDRKSWEALVSAKKVTGRLFNRAYFEQVKVGVLELAAERDGPYVKWLKFNNCQDNIENRRKFNALMDAEEQHP